MVIAPAGKSSDVLTRLGLWFGSLVLSTTLFVVLSTMLNGSAGYKISAIPFVFRATITYAFPVWFLCLPFVIAFKDAEKQRFWILLLGGTLIGPVSMALWSLTLQVRGEDPHMVWYGDPLAGIGGFACMIFALIVGFLAISIYLVSLRMFRRSSTQFTHSA
jgi:hypothetical protein